MNDRGSGSGSDNPYAVLGVPATATRRDIRSSYRAAALRHHPDRCGPAASAAAATGAGRRPHSSAPHEQFARVSAAYEILSDPEQRAAYDNDQRQKQQRQQQRTTHQSDRYLHRHQFHDPFAVFESVFREEFGVGGAAAGHAGFDAGPSLGGGRGGGSGDPYPTTRGSLFDGGAGDFFSFSPFGRSPFFGSALFGGAHHVPDAVFGGDWHRTYRDDARATRIQNRMERNTGGNDRFHPQPHVSSSSSTSRCVRRGASGDTVTTTQRTRTVHGKRQSGTETVVTAADGSVVERHVTGDASLLADHPHRNHHHHQHSRGFLDGRRRRTTRDAGGGLERGEK